MNKETNEKSTKRIPLTDYPRRIGYVCGILGKATIENIVKAYRKHPIRTTLLTGFMILSSYVTFTMEERNAQRIAQYNQTRQEDSVRYAKVYHKADINKDGNVVGEEWMKMYNKIGLFYDACKPQELTIQNLEDMLKK